MLHLIFIFVVTLVENVNFVYTQPKNSIGEESILDNVSQDLEPRILSSKPVSLGQFPWMAFIRMRDSTGTIFCGGTLIAKRFVLTAGHCCDQRDTFTKSFMIIVGEVDVDIDPNCIFSRREKRWAGYGCEKHAQEYEAERVTEYKPYDEFPYSDLCLLKTNKDVPYTQFVHPINLPFRANEMNFEKMTFDGLDLYIAGWGGTDQTSNTESFRLMMAKVKGMDLEKCKERYKEQFPDTAAKMGINKICAGNSNGSTPCRGDSGDPLMWVSNHGNTYIVGLVSGGISCSGNRPEGIPAFFTRIDWFEHWITIEMNKQV